MSSVHPLTMADVSPPSPRESPVIRRAAVTYGRRVAPTTVPDTLTTLPNTIHSRVNPDVIASHKRDHNISTPSSPSDAPMPRHHSVIDGEGSSDDDNSVASLFQFSWKKHMKEIDEEYAGISRNMETNHEGAEVDDVDPSSRHVTTTPDAADDVFGSPLPILTSSSQADRERSPSWSPVGTDGPAYRRLTRKSAVVQVSDEDADPEPYRPSTPTSPPHPYSIVTPPTRSSPTPPTSLGPSSTRGEGKGKERASVSLSSDTELHDIAAQTESEDVKRKKAKGRAKLKRAKRPTKKEREETQKVTARIIADRPVSLQRAENKKFGMSEFLGKLKFRYTAPIMPSDPIQPFSSSPPLGVVATPEEPQTAPMPSGINPPDPRAPFLPSRRPTEVFEYSELLGSKSSMVVPAAAENSDSDEEMPDVGTLLQEDHAKRVETERQKRLKQEKLRLLELQKNIVQPDADNESELEVVQDDMKIIIEEEAEDRRTSHVHHASASRQQQLAFALRSFKTTPRKQAVRQSVSEAAMLEVAAASVFSKPADDKDRGALNLTHQDVSKMLLQNAIKQAEVLQRAKEDEWIRRGGRIQGRPQEAEGADIKTKMHAIISKACSRDEEEGEHADDESGGDGESDGDYRPDNESAGVLDAEDEIGSRDADVGPLQTATDSDENSSSKVPRHRSRRGRPLAILQSDDEDFERRSSPSGRKTVPDSSFAVDGASLVEHRRQIVLSHRGSLSSLDDRTEDGTDKENDERLMFDRGEDKENTSIVVQPLVGRTPRLILGVVESLPPDSADRRSPLKDLPTEDDPDDPFLHMLSRPHARQLTFPIEPRGTSEEDAADASQSGISKLFEMATASGGPLTFGNLKNGGLSQFFTQGAKDGIDHLREPVLTAGPSLTLEIGLQPALEVNEGLRRKADSIFDKEQEIVVAESTQNVGHKSRLYIDDNGFLTQTRPKLLNAEAHRLESPAQLAPAFRPVLAETIPSRAQESVDSDGFEVLNDHPRQRIVKRLATPQFRPSSTSPSPQKPRAVNVFDLLRRHSRSPTIKERPKLGPSEFIEGEAEESDDDAMIGFGGRRNDDDGEESDEENQDQTLAELVDDAVIDEKTLGAEFVLEKVREHQEEDDRALEKVHMDAIEGKYRTKRRDRGVGFDGSDSDDDDDDARRLRRNAIIKKRRIDGDSLEELAKHQETQAFVAAYHAEDDDGDEFAHMQQDEMVLVDEDTRENENPREVTSFAQIYREVRERDWDQAQAFDTHNVSWIEPDNEDEDIGIKEVTRTGNGGPRANSDSNSAEQSRGVHEDDDHLRARMQSWAQAERVSRNFGAGRSTGGSAVTGHARAKVGVATSSGQHKSLRASEAARHSSRLAKPSSALSMVPSRRSKFGP